MFFLLFSSLLLSSEPIYINKTYCAEQDTIKASFFGYKGKGDFVLVEIPKERTQYSVSSSSIVSALSDHNISVIDSSEGVVSFKRNCNLMGKSETLEDAFLRQFQKDSPFVIIEQKPRISAKSSLPSDFKRYKLISIHISSSMLKRNSGTFVAHFQVGNKKRKLYFSYEMDAKVSVFKAKHNLLNGKILTNDDYERVLISLDKLPNRAILNDMPSNVIMKNNIPEGHILTDYQFEVKKALNKKASIRALLKEEGLVIEVQATLLDDADIGDIVKIKTDQGKVLNAKIVSSHEAIILE